MAALDALVRRLLMALRCNHTATTAALRAEIALESHLTRLLYVEYLKGQQL